MKSKPDTTVRAQMEHSGRKTVPAYTIPTLLDVPLVVVPYETNGGQQRYNITHTLTGYALRYAYTSKATAAKRARTFWAGLEGWQKEAFQSNDPGRVGPCVSQDDALLLKP